MNLVTRKREQLTPKISAQFLQHNTLDEQVFRFKERHVEYIVSLINDGLFRYASIALATCDKKKYLVNGQHTLNAVIRAGVSVDAVVEWYDCDTFEEVSLLFRQFDPSWCSRTQNQLVAFETIARGFQWDKKISGLLIAALKYNNKKVMELTTAKQVELLKTHAKEGMYLNTLIRNGDGKGLCPFLKRAPVAAAMLRTLERSHSDSVTFWSKVRDGEHLTRKDPEFLLREFLMTSSVKNNATAGKAVSAHEMLSRCISAWNCRRQNKERSGQCGIKYFPDKAVPRAV